MAVYCKVALLFIACGCTAQAGYLNDPAIRAHAERIAAAEPTKAKQFSVDLDLAPSERWAQIAPQFKEQAKGITEYIEEFLPKSIMPTIEKIASDLQGHFPQDYAEEMTSLAKYLELPVGEVVIVNLIYQVEKIGNNCSTSNNTGPCPPPKDEGPGLCTSIVANGASDTKLIHGRNLDWDIPQVLRSMMVDIKYTRGGKTVFYGSQPVSFVGVLHGTVPHKFSYSMDARNKGGNPFLNIIEVALSKGAMTPTQHARRSLEVGGSSGADFERGVSLFATGELVNPAYYIMGGVLPNEGAVVTRDRLSALNVWRIGEKSSPSDYFILQTNYDHWVQPPSYDDRRDPGNKHMEAVGKANVTKSSVFDVLTMWPTFNHHTDFTAMISASDSDNYQTYYWPNL